MRPTGQDPGTTPQMPGRRRRRAQWGEKGRGPGGQLACRRAVPPARLLTTAEPDAFFPGRPAPVQVQWVGARAPRGRSTEHPPGRNPQPTTMPLVSARRWGWGSCRALSRVPTEEKSLTGACYESGARLPPLLLGSIVCPLAD